MRVDFGAGAKWAVLFVAILASVFTTVILNDQANKNNASIVEGTINIDNGDSKIDWNRFTSYDIDLSDTLNITSSGVYHLTGSLTDQNIIVNVVDGKVKLILDDVTIKNSKGPAIVCYAADDLVIELVGKNVLEDGETYDSSYDEDVSGVIYSKDDLTLQGDGTLNLVANHLDGIVGKDDLKFNSGTYNIVASDDGIRGKDSVYIVDGDFTINANGDAIKSTNETSVGKGFILIEGGSFDLTTKAKGLKAINSILVYDGDFNITSIDDAVHTNNYIGIMGGDFTISSSDDGMHADKELFIDNGIINIKKSHEGLESQAITINGGEISIISNDDGINAGGGADSSANNRQGAGMFDANIDCILSINGGDIYINASGDGADSNGYLYFSGGTTVIDGPTNNGNGALDAGVDIVQTGGTVIAIGASGMAEAISSSSSIYNVSIYLTSTEPASTKIKIKDSAGETIASHVSAKTFNHIAIGTPDFKLGETYTIYLNDEVYDTFTISSITTTVGSGIENAGNAPMNGPPPQNRL